MEKSRQANGRMKKTKRAKRLMIGYLQASSIKTCRKYSRILLGKCVGTTIYWK